MRIFVAGAGYIGQHLIKRLLETTDHELVVVDTLYPRGDSKPIRKLQKIRNFEFYAQDVTLSQKSIEKCDVAFCLIRTTYTHERPDLLHRQLLATLLMYEMCRKANIKFIYVSSLPVEDGELNTLGTSDYCNAIVESYMHDSKIATILRTTCVSGYTKGLPPPYDFIYHMSNSIPACSLVVVSKPDVPEDYVHIEDFIDACILAISGRPGIFEVITGSSFTEQEVIATVQEITRLHFDIVSRNYDEKFAIKRVKGTKPILDGWSPKSTLHDICEETFRN